MTRPNKHIRPKKSGPAKTSFGLKSGHGQPTVPPPTALLRDAVLFLNQCGCAGWSAPLSFATPLDCFSHVVLTYSSAVLRLNSEHTNSGHKWCITF